jgi:hypothetical protein
MSATLNRVQHLANLGEIRVSDHGYDEMIEDDIVARDVVASVNEAVVVEDYPTFPKGPCVLVLQCDGARRPIHVVWGIPRGATSPAVLVTAYRPDPALWTEDFLRRRR